jgi:DNA-binding NtrC family response regulator
METNILVVGRDRAILEVIERLINAHEGWHATIAETEDAAIKAFKERTFSIVFVSAGLSAAEEETLSQQLTTLDPRVVVTRHYGGGSGLLENEILIILEKGKQ